MSEKEKIDVLDFYIALGASKHFGSNLYTSNPPAIAELVANAWDAYATECKILFSADKNELLIIDNGIGMTDYEFATRYAKSGSDKQYDIRLPKNMKERPYMGKKGIGKFSAFSLADVYELYTKSENDEEWKKIILKKNKLETDEPKVTVPIERIKDKELEYLQFKFNINLNYETGTYIYLPSLKRSITERTLSSLRQLLPRRFSTTLVDHNFSLYINDDVLDLKRHFFYNSIENIYTINIPEKQINEQFPNAKNKNYLENTLNQYISGWLATVDQPADLNADDKTKLIGVSIYINGKIADENILKNIHDARVANSYLIGEIEADYLQSPSCDPVLSSREGLNHELPEVQKLIKYLLKQRDIVIKNWDSMRATRDLEKQPYLKRALSNPQYKEFYDKLDSKSQKKLKTYSQKLFDKPSNKKEQTDILIDLLFLSLIKIINNENLEDLLKKIETSKEEVLENFEEIFRLTEINHAIRLRENATNRLQVIKELSKFVESGEVEKVFEKHLAKNPWLIEPTWIEKAKSVHTQNYFNIVEEGSDKRYYADIIIEVSDENYPVIIEIKREKATSYSQPKVNEISNQIYNYKCAIAKRLSDEKGQTIKAKDIKAYFICGEVAFKKLSVDDRERLITDGIIIRSYDQLLRTAKRIYEIHYGEDLI